MADQQHCPVCGAPVTADDRFCPNCGAQLGSSLAPLTALEPVPPASAQRWPASDPLLSLEVDFPERLSRWKIFVKWLLAIPHFVVLSIFGMLVSIFVWIA